MMKGKIGPPPTPQEYCSPDKDKQNGTLSVWRVHHGNVVKGERCPLSGHWFWIPVVKCGCEQHTFEEEEDEYVLDDEYDNYADLYDFEGYDEEYHEDDYDDGDGSYDEMDDYGSSYSYNY